MPVPLAQTLALAIELYALAGLLIGGLFALWGAARVDPGAVGAPLGFKLLVWPGAAALWPWCLWRMWRGAPPPAEHNNHRRAAQEAE